MDGESAHHPEPGTHVGGADVDGPSHGVFCPMKDQGAKVAECVLLPQCSKDDKEGIRAKGHWFDLERNAGIDSPLDLDQEPSPLQVERSSGRT